MQKICSACHQPKDNSAFALHGDKDNPSRLRGQCRSCFLERKQLSYASHRTQRRQYQSAYYRAHQETALLKRRQNHWRDENLEYARAQERAYQRSHPLESQVRCAARRARKSAAPLNDLTADQWQVIKAHYGHRCVYCDRHMQRLTQDHIIPLAKGGSHTFTNVVPACLSCNSRKGDRAPLVPVQPLLLLPC